MASSLMKLAVAGIGASVALGSQIQTHPPERIFAASCATCHGAAGTGGRSWVNGVPVPPVAGLTGTSEAAARAKVRAGSNNRGMPGFGPEEITDPELYALVSWLKNTCTPTACPPPAPPAGTEVRVDLLDADPWFTDRGADNPTDPYDDPRRVALQAADYVTFRNTGKTWHTATNGDQGIDTGFLGPAGQLGAGTGFLYAEQGTGLALGCHRYYCKLHPYMQLEVCTAGAAPAAITKASRIRIGLPPPGRTGEQVWVLAQSQGNGKSDFFDGAIQIIDADTWQVGALVADVGNNPHNAWAGVDGLGQPAVIAASWHGNNVTLVDPVTAAVAGSGAVGACPAHVQVSPGSSERWFVTIMGGNAVQEIDATRLRQGLDPNVGLPIRGQTSPHGIWFLGNGNHFVTANTLAGTMSLYTPAAELSWAPTGGAGPLNASVFHPQFPALTQAYATNSGSASVALFDVNPIAGTITHDVTAIPAAIRDGSGNLKLRDTTATPVRWAHMPIQAPVSPKGATTHLRYLVIANKASFNVMIAELSPSGVPISIVTFPAGLGAHGVAFGRKALCNSGNPNDVCFYAYVANGFEDYVSVYDLERFPGGAPGSATEQVHLEGYGATLLCGSTPCDVPVTTFCPDCRSGVLVGDLPLRKTTLGRRTYLKEELWIEPLGVPLALDLSVGTDTGAQGVLVTPVPRPWP